MSLLATLTTDQIDAWATLVDHVINRLGELAILALAVWTKVESSANNQRLNRQGERLKQVETVVPLAEVVTPPPATPEQIADAAVKRTLTAMRNAAKQQTPPTPTQT